MSAHFEPIHALRIDSLEARALREGLVADLERIGDVVSPRVRDAMLRVPRHEFVPDWVPLRQAYANRPLPIGFDQTISQPTVVAMMTEALDLSGDEWVLEIGTGSGYQAAVLAQLAREVYTIEIVPTLGERAAATLARLGYRNVHVRVGDGQAGWPEHAPFDRIIVTAATPIVPPELFAQLGPGGILVAPVGTAGDVQQLRRFHKQVSETTVEHLGAVSFVPLTGGRPS